MGYGAKISRHNAVDCSVHTRMSWLCACSSTTLEELMWARFQLWKESKSLIGLMLLFVRRSFVVIWLLLAWYTSQVFSYVDVYN